MEPKKNYIITFAGPIGSSKTPIAYYLSQQLQLPILNNDSLRTEVIEDLGQLDTKEYEQRRDERFYALIRSKKSFIYDASIDRKWGDLQKVLSEYEYDHFVISLDYSKAFLQKLYELKGYTDSLKRIDENVQDHENFLSEYKDVVNLSIKEEQFKDRLPLSLNAIKEWLI